MTCWLLTFSVDRLEDRCEYLLKEKKELHDKNIGVSLYNIHLYNMYSMDHGKITFFAVRLNGTETERQKNVNFSTTHTVLHMHCIVHIYW